MHGESMGSLAAEVEPKNSSKLFWNGTTPVQSGTFSKMSSAEPGSGSGLETTGLQGPAGASNGAAEKQRPSPASKSGFKKGSPATLTCGDEAREKPS
jgi:hypothetical protein